MRLAASGGGRRRHSHGRAAGARAADPTSQTGAAKVDAAPRRCQPCRALLRPSCSPVDGDPSWRPAAVIWRMRNGPQRPPGPPIKLGERCMGGSMEPSFAGKP